MNRQRLFTTALFGACDYLIGLLDSRLVTRGFGGALGRRLKMANDHGFGWATGQADRRQIRKNYCHSRQQ